MASGPFVAFSTLLSTRFEFMQPLGPKHFSWQPFMHCSNTDIYVMVIHFKSQQHLISKALAVHVGSQLLFQISS